MEEQAASEMMSQLSPFMVDTSNPAKVAQHPMPLVDANSVMAEIFDKKHWDRKHLLQYSKLEQNAVDRAKGQNFEAFSGTRPMAHPGESREHIFIHTQFQKELIRRLEDMTAEIQRMIVRNMNPTAEYKMEFDMTKTALDIITEHIQEDSMPAYAETQMTNQKAQAMTSPMPQGAGQMMNQPELGNVVTLNGLGGNQTMPNLPAQQGMQGGPGQIGGIINNNQ